MNREIKFRVWNKDQEYMMSWEQLINIQYNEINCIFSDTGYILMQLTGLKDSTGKEIYEGDILGDMWLNGLNNESALVIFDDGAFCLELEAGKYCPCLYEIPQEKRKIIGNKFQTKSPKS